MRGQAGRVFRARGVGRVASQLRLFTGRFNARAWCLYHARAGKRDADIGRLEVGAPIAEARHAPRTHVAHILYGAGVARDGERETDSRTQHSEHTHMRITQCHSLTHI